MTPIDVTPSKSEILLRLSIAAHSPDPRDADAQLRLRKGFDAIMAAVRKIDGVPAADIDEFIRDARAGAGVEALTVPAVLFATALPDEDWLAAMVGSGMFEGASQCTAKPAHHPKFVAAMERLKELQDQHGEAVMDLPENNELWAQAFKHAPPAFMQAAHEVAAELNLLPETQFVNDAGEPVYSVEQIADKFGMPVEEVEKKVHELLGDHLPVGNVHRVQ